MGPYQFADLIFGELIVIMNVDLRHSILNKIPQLKLILWHQIEKTFNLCDPLCKRLTVQQCFTAKQFDAIELECFLNFSTQWTVLYEFQILNNYDFK